MITKFKLFENKAYEQILDCYNNNDLTCVENFLKNDNYNISIFLFSIITTNKLEMFDLFIKYGADINEVDKPLHNCKSFDMFKKVVDAGANINELDYNKRTILMTVMATKKDKEFSYLLKQPGIDLEYEYNGKDILDLCLMNDVNKTIELLYNGVSMEDFYSRIKKITPNKERSYMVKESVLELLKKEHTELYKEYLIQKDLEKFNI